MPRVTQGIQNFASGELSPRMRGRYDIPLYFNGAERIENFIVEAQGPARYRTGFRYVESTYKNNPAVLIPFVFNDEQSYILEFTEGRGRIFKDEGLVLGDDLTVSSIVAFAPLQLSISSHGLSVGDEVYLWGFDSDEIDGNYATVTSVPSASQIVLDFDIPSDTYTMGYATIVPHFTHPFLTSELFEIRYAQQADTMYMVHRNHAPRKLTRSDHDAWACATFTRTNDPFTGAGKYPGSVTFFEQRTWYAGTNDDPQKFWCSQSSNYDNFTENSPVLDTDAFNATLATKQTNVVRWIEGNDDLIVFGANGGNIKLSGSSGAFTPTNFQAKPLDYFGSAAISPIIKDNRIIYCQQDLRKIRAIEYNYDMDSYTPADLTKIADHISVGNIKQMAYQDGRPDVVWAIKENGDLVGLTYDPNEAITGWHRHSTGVEFNDEFYAISVMPQISLVDQLWAVNKRVVDSETKYYVEFMEGAPDYPERGDYYTGDDLADEQSYLYALWETQKHSFHLDSGLTYNGSALELGDMTLAALTGDDITLTSTDSSFVSSMEGREIWAKGAPGRAVIKSIDSSSTATVEITQDFIESSLVDGNYYLTATSLSGLNHLEGREVSIVTDGAVHPVQTVSDGSVSLNYAATVIHVGLTFNGFIKSMNLEAGGANGPAHGKTKNVHKIDIRLLNTVGVSIGEDPYKMNDLLFRNTNSLISVAPLLQSGIKEVKFSGTHGKDKHVLIRQSSPLPCTIQFIGVNLNTGDL